MELPWYVALGIVLLIAAVAREAGVMLIPMVAGGLLVVVSVAIFGLIATALNMVRFSPGGYWWLALIAIVGWIALTAMFTSIINRGRQ